MATTNAAGGLIASLRYDAYGNLEVGVTNGYGFTGREWDAAANLAYYRARYYDPQTGRFVSEDPLGLGAGINFFVYIDNNPVLLVDPSGLQAGRPWPPIKMTCGQAMNNAWTFFGQVKENKLPIRSVEGLVIGG